MPAEVLAQLTPVATAPVSPWRNRWVRYVLATLPPAAFALSLPFLFGESAAWALLFFALLGPPLLLLGWVGVGVFRALRP